MSKLPSPPAPREAPTPPGWRAPTRRSFVALLGGLAAALVVREQVEPPAPAPRSTWTGTTRWIGHC